MKEKTQGGHNGMELVVEIDYSDFMQKDKCRCVNGEDKVFLFICFQFI